MQKNNSKLQSLNKRTYSFSLKIIELTNVLPNKRSSWVIGDQLLRSATSVGANVVEARASSSRREFKKFFEIALKSSNESVYWLNLLKDAKLAPVSKVTPIIAEAEELGRILGKSVITLKAKM